MNSTIIPLLPFWILGVPLIIGVISWPRTPKQGDLTHADHSRNNAR